MAKDRNIYKYHLKKGNKIVHTGITGDIDRREMEHKRTYGDNHHIKQVGRRTTREAALTWEAQQRKAGKPTENH